MSDRKLRPKKITNGQALDLRDFHTKRKLKQIVFLKWIQQLTGGAFKTENSLISYMRRVEAKTKKLRGEKKQEFLDEPFIRDRPKPQVVCSTRT